MNAKAWHELPAEWQLRLQAEQLAREEALLNPRRVELAKERGALEQAAKLEAEGPVMVGRCQHCNVPQYVNPEVDPRLAGMAHLCWKCSRPWEAEAEHPDVIARRNAWAKVNHDAIIRGE